MIGRRRLGFVPAGPLWRCDWLSIEGLRVGVESVGEVEVEKEVMDGVRVL